MVYPQNFLTPVKDARQRHEQSVGARNGGIRNLAEYVLDILPRSGVDLPCGNRAAHLGAGVRQRPCADIGGEITRLLRRIRHQHFIGNRGARLAPFLVKEEECLVPAVVARQP